MRFRLIDQVLEQTDTRIIAVKNVTSAEEYLGDHFPTFPVLPGVFMLEALVQAGRRLLGDDGRRFVLGGVKARCPFLDARLSRTALEIPGSFKRDRDRVKVPLLEASRDLLPQWLLDRRKQPFTGPVLGWLRSSLRPRLQDLARGSDPRLSERVDVARLVETLDRPEAVGGIANRLWSLLILETWLVSTAPRFANPSPEQLDAT